MGKRGAPAPAPALQGGLISPRPRWLHGLVTPGSCAGSSSLLPEAGQAGRGGGLTAQPDTAGRLCVSPPRPQMPAEPARAEGQTQPCCPAPPGTHPRAPSLHQLPPQLLGTTEPGTIKPPDWVPPDQVPPNHQPRYHQLGYHQLRYHQATGSCTTRSDTTGLGTTKPPGSATTEPQGHVPPGQVPPNHKVVDYQVGFHQVRCYQATASRTTTSGTAGLGPTKPLGQVPLGRAPPSWVPPRSQPRGWLAGGGASQPLAEQRMQSPGLTTPRCLFLSPVLSTSSPCKATRPGGEPATRCQSHFHLGLPRPRVGVSGVCPVRIPLHACRSTAAPHKHP